MKEGKILQFPKAEKHEEGVGADVPAGAETGAGADT